MSPASHCTTSIWPEETVNLRKMRSTTWQMCTSIRTITLLWTRKTGTRVLLGPFKDRTNRQRRQCLGSMRSIRQTSVPRANLLINCWRYGMFYCCCWLHSSISNFLIPVSTSKPMCCQLVIYHSVWVVSTCTQHEAWRVIYLSNNELAYHEKACSADISLRTLETSSVRVKL